MRVPLPLLWLASVSLLLSSCMRSCGGEAEREAMSPEDVVKEYLHVVFNVTSLSDRQKILDFTTGSLRETLAAASDDAFREAYVVRKYVLDRFTVLERRDRTPRETEITFEIVYRDMAQEGPDDHLKPEEIPTVTVQNTVSVVREKKRWLIGEVLNKKSSFYFPVATKDTEIRAKPAE